MIGHHDPLLVALSVLLAMMASYAALSLTGRVAVVHGPVRMLWICGGGLAMGTGIWNMHFMGMLAFQLPVPIAYDAVLLVTSWVIAVLASLLALFVASHPSVRWPALAGAALLMGAAISGMHYTGMAAVRVPADITYRVGWVIASVTIAVLASLAALVIALNLRTTKGWAIRKVLASMAMGLAIAGMHYSAMVAAQFGAPIPHHATPNALTLDTRSMVWAVVTTSFLVLPLAIFGSWMDRQLRDTNTRAADAVRDREERFRALIENAEDGMLIMSETSATIYVSPSLARTLGPGALVLGGSGFEAVHPDDRSGAQGALAGVLKRPNQKATLDLRVQDADRSWRTLTVTLQNLLHNPAVRGVVVNTRDVTQHKQIEEQLRQVQKIEAVGRLAGGVAHDFNNLLTVITGHSQLVLEEKPTAQVTEHMKAITGAADRAANLTHQLLAFSRRQVLRPRVLSLNRIIDGLRPLIGPLLTEDIRIVDRRGDSLWPIKADPTQLEQVIMNLVVNARDAMPAGGDLIFETRDVTLKERFDRDFLYEFVPGDYVLLTVQDTGCGIDRATQHRMFEPFFTTKEIGRGTGLGLSTVYGIMKQSGGFVWVESEVGVGTRFNLYFPRSLETDEAHIPVLAATTRRFGGRVMVVEDEPAVRHLVAKVLTRAGFDVLTATEGADAVTQLEAYPALDLLITDLAMPGMSGRELAARVLELHGGVKVLYMSGYSFSEIQSHGVAHEGALFLEKPFTVEVLLDHVARLLALNQPVEGGVLG